jgi:hypothetical protein
MAEARFLIPARWCDRILLLNALASRVSMWAPEHFFVTAVASCYINLPPLTNGIKSITKERDFDGERWSWRRGLPFRSYPGRARDSGWKN